MSFSEPRLQNPATKFIEFRDGKLQYYNKESEENIKIDLPVYFVVLDELSTISGFCEKTKSGIYSNEVHRITDEIINVRTFKGGEQIMGLYKDISDAIARLGGRFTKSVYALLINQQGGENELVNFKFRGAAFSGWLDKKLNAEKHAVGIIETFEATKGTTVYQVPVFKSFRLTPELIEEATEMDKKLQVYLKTYKANQAEAEKAPAEDEIIEPETVGEEIPANGQWQGKSSKEQIVEKAKAEIIEDDLPFIFTIPITLGILAQLLF